MLRSTRNTLALVAAAAITAGAFIVPAAASAKTYKASLVVAGTQDGFKLKGTVKGAPLGSCTYTGTLKIPNTNQLWKCKGGTISVVTIGTSGAAEKSTGNWRFTKGTGKYKGIKGSGTLTGRISTATFKWVGKVSY